MFEDGFKRRRALCSHHRISTAVTAGAAGGGSDAQVICCASAFPLFSPVRLPRHRCQCSAGDVGSVQYTIVGCNTPPAGSGGPNPESCLCEVPALGFCDLQFEAIPQELKVGHCIILACSRSPGTEMRCTSAPRCTCSQTRCSALPNSGLPDPLWLQKLMKALQNCKVQNIKTKMWPEAASLR